MHLKIAALDFPDFIVCELRIGIRLFISLSRTVIDFIATLYLSNLLRV